MIFVWLCWGFVCLGLFVWLVLFVSWKNAGRSFPRSCAVMNIYIPPCLLCYTCPDPEYQAAKTNCVFVLQPALVASKDLEFLI